MITNKHISVLTTELIGSLPIQSNVAYVDATLGGGGHSVALIKKLLEANCRDVDLITCDLDQQAWKLFLKNLVHSAISYEEITDEEIIVQNLINVKFRLENFAEIKLVTQKKIVGFIADLGPSQNLLNADNGLSYLKDNYLDMRISRELSVTASDLLAVLSKKQLCYLFREYADLKYALTLSEKIIDYRLTKKITTTYQLNEIVKQVLIKINIPSTGKELTRNLAKVYQAFRIAVNLEYDNLSQFISNSYERLSKTGILALITFHSGEQKVVSKFLKSLDNSYQVRVVEASSEELEYNARSRSAKLYILTK